MSTRTIHTVRKARVGHWIAHLSSARLREVRAAIEFALGLDQMG